MERIKIEFETISEILERHYNNADVIGDLSLGDLEDDLELNKTRARQQERKNLKSRLEIILTDPDNYLRGQLKDLIKEYEYE